MGMKLGIDKPLAHLAYLVHITATYYIVAIIHMSTLSSGLLLPACT